MSKSTKENYIATSVNGFLWVTALLLNCRATQVIHKKREKSVSDVLILHLLITEFLGIICSIVNNIVSFFSIKAIYLIADRIILTTIITAIMQEIIYITLDQVLLVALNLKYRARMTKLHLIPVFVSIWFIAFLHGVCGGYLLNDREYDTMWLIWDIMTTLTIAVCYMYIIIAVRKRRNQISPSNVTPSYRHIKYHVPLLVSSSFIIFNVVPSVLIYSAIVALSNKWITILYIMGTIFDPLMYVLYSKAGFCKRNIQNNVVPSIQIFHCQEDQVESGNR